MSTTTVDTRGAVVVTGPEPIVIDPAAKRQPILNAEDARRLTAEIQRTSARLWILVTEAHDRKAHFALGYDTWDDYARAELGMSPSRSYQLLDTGHVMREMAAAGVDIESATAPSARVVSKVKNRLPDVRRAVRQATRAGESPEKAIRALARSVVMPAEKQAEGIPPPEGAPTPRRAGLVLCPACEGSGKVSRSLGNTLRAFVRDRARR